MHSFLPRCQMQGNGLSALRTTVERNKGRATSLSVVAILSVRLREQEVEHFANHALACARELTNAFNCY